MDRYDYLVVGGGSGGLASARRAASLGARTLLIEPGKLGGTCVNLGCVPKKMMWYAAQIAEAVEDAGDYGFDLTLRGFDWAGMKERRDAYLARLNAIYAENLARDGVELLRERADLLEAHTISVGDRRLSAEHVLIATGGAPRVPAVEGAELGITSDGFFELRERPPRVLIVGGGYIAAEFSSIFKALGSEVTVVFRAERLLHHFDELLSDTLFTALSAAGIELMAGLEVRAVRREADALVANLNDGRSIHADCLIWAIGRVPNTAWLTPAEIRLTADGSIWVDEYQNTNRPGVYAVGDVTGRAPLTPVAIAAGRRLADRVFGGQVDAKLEYEKVPTVVFSHPPIATVGLSEAVARAAHGDAVKSYTRRFRGLYHAVTSRSSPSAVKLVTVGPDERVLGIHAIGLGADELIQGFSVALGMGATKADFDRTVAVHPTTAEELVTLR